MMRALDVTRRAAVLAAIGSLATLTGCAVPYQMRALIDYMAPKEDTMRDQAVADVLAVMRAEMGETDGRIYEDALIDAGGELCGNKRGLWCVTFLWWAYREAGYEAAFCGGKPIAWPHRQAAWYRDHGQFDDTLDDAKPPRPGDLYYMLLEPEYRFDGCEDVSHGEFIVSYDETRHVVTCVSANPIVELHEHYLLEDIENDKFRGIARVEY